MVEIRNVDGRTVLFCCPTCEEFSGDKVEETIVLGQGHASRLERFISWHSDHVGDLDQEVGQILNCMVKEMALYGKVYDAVYQEMATQGATMGEMRAEVKRRKEWIRDYYELS